MPPVAPLSAEQAAKARNEVADSGFNDGRKGTVNTAVYADQAVNHALEAPVWFRGLDTAGGDQQLPTRDGNGELLKPVIPAATPADSVVIGA